MTDKSVGSIAWLADMLGRAWAPLGPPLAPIESGSAPIGPAAPATPLPEAAVAVSAVPLQRARRRKV